MKRKLLLLFLLLVASLHNVMAQDPTAAGGRVLDETGQGMVGAAVSVKGTSVGTVTDLDGYFELSVPSGGSTLLIQAIGYASQEVRVGTGLTIRLTRNARELTGAVVTALGIRREKREIGYSATTLSNQDLTSGNNVSVLSAIQGKTAGVNITSTTGGPGGSTRIVLRGEKSLTRGNNALIVVDGVIINNNSRLAGPSDLEQIDFGNQGNDINPDDVESITVLKGPAAAALYGSQGANGAIMITTKSGKNRKGTGKTEISFSSTYTLSNVLKLPTLQNRYGQGNIYVGSYPADPRENFSWGDEFDGQLRPWGQVIDGHQLVKPYSAEPDNIRRFFNTGQTTENYLSLAGGQDKTSFFLSLGTLNNKGVIPNTFYNKYNVRFNASTELSNHFYSSLNLDYITINQRVESNGQAKGSVIDNLYQTPRDIPVWELKDYDTNPFYSVGYPDANGILRYGFYGAYAENPYWLAEQFDNRDKTDRVIGNFILGYKNGPHFDIYNRFSVDALSDRVTTKTPKYSYVSFDELWADNPKNSKGGYFQSTNNAFSLNNDIILNYHTDFTSDFGLDALFGNNVQMNVADYLSGEIDPSSNGLVIPGYYNLANAEGAIVPVSNTIKSRLVGIYADLRLNYKKFLFLELTGRNDWTSTLDESNRSFFYPSANLSYIFTEHYHISPTSFLSYGKVRAGLASVGNGAGAYDNNNAAFVTASGLSTGFGTTNFPFNGEPGFTLQNRLGKPLLAPEKTFNWEIGTELGFWHSRASLELTYYYNKSTENIIALPAPPSSGFTSLQENFGEIENKGIEVALRVTPIRTATGFSWELFGTYTKNNNKVLSLANGVNEVVVGGFSGLSIVAEVGQPYGELKGIDLLRDPAGRVIVDSSTGLPIRTLTTVDKGTFQPRFIASWGTNLHYKGFSLNVLFDTKQGGVFYTHTKRNLDFNGTALETIADGRDPRIWYNSVIPDGNGGYVKNTTSMYLPYDFYTNDAQTVSAIHVVDASYIKLREASLTWAIPTSWLSHTFIGTGSLSVFGNNLAIWTSDENKYVDPEMNSGGATNEQGFEYEARPSLRNYGIRLNVTF